MKIDISAADLLLVKEDVQKRYNEMKSDYDRNIKMAYRIEQLGLREVRLKMEARKELLKKIDWAIEQLDKKDE